MKNNTRRILAALMSAVMFAQPVLAATDYYVVVPVHGRTGTKLSVAITLSTAVLPEGVSGQAYSGFDFASSLQVTGDPAFTSGAVTWGAMGLPAGMTLSGVGLLTGTPTQAFSGTVRVTANYKGISQEQDYALTVTADGVPPIETPPEPPATGGSDTITDGQAALTVAPVSLSFGAIPRLVDSAPIPVTISNTGTAPAALVVGPALSSQFKVTHNCPANLAVGANCVAQVVANITSTATTTTSRFPVKLGAKEATISLSAAGRNASVSLTHVPLLVSNLQDFGVVAVGQFATAKTTLTNISSYTPLALNSVAISGVAPSYTVTHDCPASLAPGASCVVTSKYAPVDSKSHSGTVRLAMNVSGGYRDIYLRGVGAGSLAVTALSSAGATLAGGGTLTVTGSGFMPGAKIYFGDTEVATTYSSTTSVSATIPAVAAAEDTLVKVVNTDGASATAATVFKRLATFAKFTAPPPVDFGNQPVGMNSAWKSLSFSNAGYSSTDTFSITGIQVSGPYELYVAPGYCAAGVTLTKTGSCIVRLRFKPTAGGTQSGTVTVQGSGTEVALALTGTGSGWDAVPSSSGTSNIEVDATAVLSGNEALGGATQTSTMDIFLRNSTGAGQVAASFKLENGSAAKLTTIYKTGISPTTTGCLITGGVQTAVCLADVGSGSRPHLQVRITFSSAVGLGTFEDTLVISDAAGTEQYRIPVTLNVINNAQAEVSSAVASTVPLPSTGLSFGAAPLATESFMDVYLRNVGTHGMLRTNSVKLVDTPPELYMKSGVSLYTVSTAGAVSACSTFVNSTELTNCLADDVNGGAKPHARVRIYFKPMAAGTYTGTLTIDQSGLGENPIQIPLDAGAPGTTQVFAANLSTAPVPELVVPENYSVDGTNTSTTLMVYLNKTGGTGLLTGYFDLPEAQTGKLILQSPMSISLSNSNGYACNGTASQSGLCTTTTYYSSLKVSIQAYASLGEGTYTANLRFLDPAKNELSSVPITVRVVNDATATPSSSVTGTVALPNNTLNFGSATLATAPGQPSVTVSKSLYIRNTGSYGKLKISRALIEGGDGAFSYVNSTLALAKAYSTSTASCMPTRVSNQEITGCAANDPQSGSLQHILNSLVYTPTQPGVQAGTLSLWHNSKTAPNPLVVPIEGNSQQVFVAGAMSGSPSSITTAPSTFGTLASSTTYKDITIYIRNPGAYGALYTEDVSVSGDSAFRVASVSKTNSSGSAGACGASISGDLRSASPCLAESPDDGTYTHIKVGVRCYPPSSGSFTGQLRVQTQGKEHLQPLTCSKN